MKHLLLAAVAAVALPPEPAQAAPVVMAAPGEWVLKQTEHACSIAMLPAGPHRHELTFAVTPGQDLVSGSLGGELPRIGSPSGQTEVDLVLIPSMYRATAIAMRTRDPDTRDEILVYWGLPEALIDHLARSTALAIEAKNKRRVEVQFADPVKAVGELRACNEIRMKRWGLDTAALAKLKRKPKLVLGSYLFDTNDYPRDSQRRGEQGTAVVRFTVDVDGRAKACSPVVSSGFSALDAQSCKSILFRSRFEPALDTQGNKTASETVAVIRWALGR